MRWSVGVLVVACGCGSSAASSPSPSGAPGAPSDAGDGVRDAGSVVILPDAGGGGADASDGAAPPAFDAGVDPFFNLPCRTSLVPPSSDCGDSTSCTMGWTNTGGQFDAGVEMHGHCSWFCGLGGDWCGDVHVGGPATPGSRCVLMNDGTGHVGGAVCAPPAH